MSTTDTFLLILILFFVLACFGAAHRTERIMIILERIRKGDRDQF